MTFTHTDSPDVGTGRTCFGGGMHCPSASSLKRYQNVERGTKTVNGIEHLRYEDRPNDLGLYNCD